MIICTYVLLLQYSNSMATVPQSPYSADLCPSDFFQNWEGKGETRNFKNAKISNKNRNYLKITRSTVSCSKKCCIDTEGSYVEVEYKSFFTEIKIQS